MSKKNTLQLRSVYKGDIYKDLPLIMHFLQSMKIKDEAADTNKETKVLKVYPSEKYNTKCFEYNPFHKHISRIIKSKNE